MSLEQAITDHASALRELAAAIRATISGAHDIATTTDKVISDAKKTDGDKAVQAAIKTVAEANPEQLVAAVSSKAADNKAVGDTPAPTYDDVKAKVLALSKDKGREPTVQLLERHGVAKAPDLKPEQYADFIKDVDAIMAGTYNPEAAELA